LSSTIPELLDQIGGWWRIVETGTWGSEHLDLLGPAMLSLTGHADRLRMLALLAYVNAKPTKSGVSFTWEGAWIRSPARAQRGWAVTAGCRGRSGSKTATAARSSR
jgi:hypothetical protein